MSAMETSVLALSKYSGFNHLFKAFFASNTIVLMYHGVARDDWEASEHNWLQVKESEFRKQMTFLSKHYHVVSMDEAIYSFGHKTDKPKAVITFDDGYANNFNVAYPILKELELPATIFLVSSMIGTSNLFWYDKLRASLKGSMDDKKIENIVQSYKLKHPHMINDLVSEFIRGVKLGRRQAIQEAYGVLSLNQIREMQTDGLITFDSHTHRHEILTQLVGVDEPTETIGTSLDALRGFGIDCGNVFCYPNGLYAKHHIDILKHFGFKAGTNTVSTNWTPSTSPYEIPRFGVGRNLTTLQFEHMITGLWSLFGNTKQALTRTFSFATG